MSGDESEVRAGFGFTTSCGSAPPSSHGLQRLRARFSHLLLQMPFTSPGTDPKHVGDLWCLSASPPSSIVAN